MWPYSQVDRNLKCWTTSETHGSSCDTCVTLTLTARATVGKAIVPREDQESAVIILSFIPHCHTLIGKADRVTNNLWWIGVTAADFAELLSLRNLKIYTVKNTVHTTSDFCSMTQNDGCLQRSTPTPLWALETYSSWKPFERMTARQMTVTHT